MATHQTLRVGYVNVQGLSAEKWKQACWILESLFDFLFLAETWFVQRAVDECDRRLICMSTKPPKPSSGRYGGGIYLLGTASARSLLPTSPSCTVHSISLRAAGLTVSAVYLPPSMDPMSIDGILSDLSHSSVVLGDVNTRFPGVSAGRNHSMRPPDRVRLFAAFQQKQHFRLLEPTMDRKRGLPRKVRLARRLVVDHCFVAHSIAEASLMAFSNDSLGLTTDHDYTLGVTIGSTPKQTEADRNQAPRYAVSRLLKGDTKQAVRQAFAVESRRYETGFYRQERVDVLDAWLLGICQRVCQRELGYARTGTVQRRERPRQKSSTLVQDRQDTDASVRLYKLAKASSRENEPIQPSEDAAMRGETALDELDRMFATRYTAEHHPESISHAGPFHAGRLSSAMDGGRRGR